MGTGVWLYKWRHASEEQRKRWALILERRRHGKTFREIAEELGVSRARAHQLSARAERINEALLKQEMALALDTCER